MPTYTKHLTHNSRLVGPVQPLHLESEHANAAMHHLKIASVKIHRAKNRLHRCSPHNLAHRLVLVTESDARVDTFIVPDLRQVLVACKRPSPRGYDACYSVSSETDVVVQYIPRDAPEL